MDIVYGTYYRTLQDGRNKTFVMHINDISFKQDSPYITCEGVLIHKIAGLPLELKGRYDKNSKTFFVSDYTIVTKTSADVSSLLSRFEIKKNDAEKIARESNNDIFSYFKDKTVIHQLQNIGISQNDAETLYMWCNQINDYEAIYRRIHALGGSLDAVERIYNKYGHSGPKMLEENPYLLVYAGLTFAECEVLAKQSKIPYYDNKRIHALVKYVIESNQLAGNSRIEIQKLLTLIERFESRQNLYTTKAEFILAELSKAEYITEKEDDCIYVYKDQAYNEEVEIAASIKRLCNATTYTPKKTLSINDLEKMCGITYGNSQKDALGLLRTPGVKVLTGGPGTGKTTTLNGLLTRYIYENPDSKILLCAPTGCAAKRITESTQHTAVTIHKALDIRPFCEEKMIANKEILDYDCVIVDESSMIDATIFAMLISTLKTGSILLLVGDKDQLESVGYGDVFNSIISSEVAEVKVLDVNYRQGENNSIILNSQKINKSNVKLLFDEKSQIIRKDRENDMVSTIKDLYIKYFDPNDPNCVKIYTPTRKKYLTSSTNLNNEIKKIVNPVDGKSITSNGYIFSEGDFVLMNKNNYTVGYMNGDVGIIRDIQINGYSKRVTISIDGELIEISNNCLADMELAYAQTIHKAQGSECKHAIIAIPKKPQNMLSKKLIYVAATRAKEVNFFVSENYALEYAIKNTRKMVRQTGLAKKIVNLFS